MRFSGNGSLAFRNSVRSSSFDQINVCTNCTPRDMRFETLMLRLLKDEVPELALRTETPEPNVVPSVTGYSGNGANNCPTVVFEPFKFVPGNRPAKGFATCELRALMTF